MHNDVKHNALLKVFACVSHDPVTVDTAREYAFRVVDLETVQTKGSTNAQHA